jgi:DNA-binding NarL/FixJ family response regulator
VETVARMRREHFINGKTVKEIARNLKVSRNAVRKVLRLGQPSFGAAPVEARTMDRSARCAVGGQRGLSPPASSLR